MSAEVERMLRQADVRCILMAEIDHPIRFVRAWNGLGDIEFEGNLYNGFGTVGTISPIKSSTEIEVPEVIFELPGVDVEYRAGLSQSVKGRFASVYEAILDRTYRIVERELLFRCRLNFQTYRLDPESGTLDVKLYGQAGLFHLLSRSSAKISAEEARAVDPDETGYDEVYKQQDENLYWTAA